MSIKTIAFKVFLLFPLFGYTNGFDEIRKVNKEPNFKVVKHSIGSQEEIPLAKVGCKITIVNDSGIAVVYSATAGNWFMSVPKAAERCKKKLSFLGEAEEIIVYF